MHSNLEKFGSYQVNFFEKLLGFGTSKPNVNAGILTKLHNSILKKYVFRTRPIVDKEFLGLKFRLSPSQNACDWWIAMHNKHYEEDELELLAQFKGQTMNFLDIGANIGTFSLWMHKNLSPESKIISFEPHPQTFQRLSVNMSLNNASNITPLNFAVGEEHTHLWLDSFRPNNAGRCSLRTNYGTEKNRMKVAVIPLLDALKNEGLDRVDLIKIDVEGYEDKALIPFFENATESMWPTYILIETVANGLWDTDLLAYLKYRNYFSEFKNSENTLLKRHQN